MCERVPGFNALTTSFLSFQFLLEAEIAAVKGNKISALSKYTTAVALLREAGMVMQCALANERAGIYSLSIGDNENGYPFLKEAFKLYREWGCALKLDCLTKEFGEMSEKW